jgi:hypothetical protein
MRTHQVLIVCSQNGLKLIYTSVCDTVYIKVFKSQSANTATMGKEKLPIEQEKGIEVCIVL